MSKKINNYIVLDYETGGLDCKRNPIVEFACVVLLGTNYEQILAYDTIIKPYDESLLYEEGATKVHGLSKEVCQRDGVQLSKYVEDFIQVCLEANPENSKIARPILVGHNPTFDVGFLQETARRAKLDLSKYLAGYTDAYGNFQPHVLDTLQLCKNAEGHSNDKLLKFSLTECCRRFGVEVVDGHRALNDVLATKELFVQLMTRLRSSATSEVGVGVSRYRDTFAI